MRQVLTMGATLSMVGCYTGTGPFDEVTCPDSPGTQVDLSGEVPVFEVDTALGYGFDVIDASIAVCRGSGGEACESARDGCDDELWRSFALVEAPVPTVEFVYGASTDTGLPRPKSSDLADGRTYHALASRSGDYVVSVRSEGTLECGDVVEWVQGDPKSTTLRDCGRLP